MQLLNSLNDEQKRAARIADGPVLVIAGAGTGKTEIITKRISYLLEKNKAKAGEILALTFTEKAADEMLTRVDELSSYIYPDLTVTTFHGFGEQILRVHALDMGLTSEYRLLGEAEQLLFLRDNIFKLDLDYFMPKSDPTAFIAELLRLFSRAKDELVTPEEFLKLRRTDKEEDKKIRELAAAYKRYNELLLEAGYVDYGDLIYLPYMLFKKHPTLLKKWKNKFKYFLVDEFQDTNYGQYELLKILAKGSQNVGVEPQHGPNIFVVADDDQAIYRFRGAAVYNVMTFLSDFPRAKKITLTKNYRSTKTILDHAYQFIQHNNPDRLEAVEKISKKLTAAAKVTGPAPSLVTYATESDEAEGIAEEVGKLNGAGVAFKDIAVLVRANKHGEPIVRALARHKIPHVFSGASGLYGRAEVKLALYFFEAIADPTDNLNLYHHLTGEVYDLDVEPLAELMHAARYENKTLFELIKRSGNYKKVVEEINFYRELSKKESAGQLLNMFLNRSGYLKKLIELQDEGDAEAANKIVALGNFFDRIVDFQRRYLDHSLQKFVEFIRLMLSVGEDPKAFEIDAAVDAVHVLTIHKAKGLEFDTVIISSLSDSHFPGRAIGEASMALPDELIKEKKPTGDEHMLEERRLFYVAMTRAKSRLYFTAALDYGTKRTHKISRLVLEALPGTKIPETFVKSVSIEKLKHFEVVEDVPELHFKPIPESEMLTVSRQKIDDYGTCPLKFKYIHVLNLKIMPDSAVAYGNTVHNTIAEYFKRRESGRSVTASELIKIYEDKWENYGFISPEHEELRFKKGKEALARFHKIFNKKPLPESVEEPFKFELGNSVIEGRFDMVEKERGRVRIVDFKTSDLVNSDETADRRTKQSTQLKIYAYAYQKLHGKLPNEVSLNFIDAGYQGYYSPTEKDMEDIEALMRDAVAGIRAQNFKATPSTYVCSYCPYRLVCPYAMTDKVSS